MLLPGRDELLDERPHVLELGVRLLGREVAHGRNPMLRRVDAEAAQPRPRPSHVRLAVWAAFVGADRAGQLRGPLQRRKRRQQGRLAPERLLVLDVRRRDDRLRVWLGIVLLICIDRFDLLALRAPRSWGRALGLAAARRRRDPRRGRASSRACRYRRAPARSRGSRTSTGSRRTPAPSPPTSSSSP